MAQGKHKPLTVYPNKKNIKRLMAPMLKLPRGEDYCSAEHISHVLNPTKVNFIHNSPLSLVPSFARHNNTINIDNLVIEHKIAKLKTANILVHALNIIETGCPTTKLIIHRYFIITSFFYKIAKFFSMPIFRSMFTVYMLSMTNSTKIKLN